jgi:hypothetical protein
VATQIYLRDPFGTLQTIINGFVRLEYGRAESKTGYLTLDLDPVSTDTSLFRVDTRLEPWRTVGANAPYLDGESVFFVRAFGYITDNSGREIFRVEAQDANYLLASRHVAYAAGTTQAAKTGKADDLCKAIVRENLGASATDATRSLAAYLSVQADLALGPTVTKEFSRRIVSDVLTDLVQESFQQGTYLAYDTVYTGAATLEFRTYTGRRGVDHGRASGQTVVISRERKNLESPSFIEDHSEEYTAVYAGGQGLGADRVVKSATNSTAAGLSPFNLREKWVDARNTATDAAIQSEANAGLQTYRAKKVLTGNIIDADGCLYGVHYNFGDVVYAEYRGQGYDAHINAIHVTVENGRETIDCQVRAEA